jgi:predicted TIM-barrel enzyme
MIRLAKTLSAWGTPVFEAILKQEIAQLGADHLPLQQGLSTGNYVTDDPITVAIHSVAEIGNVIRVKAGIFYTGVIGGCSCADDPTPTSDINEYCEVQLDIDKETAVTAIALVTELAD